MAPRKLSDASIERLSAVNEKLQGNDRYLMAFISLPCLKDAGFIEPSPMPSPEERMKLIKRLYNKKIPAFAALRPILPQVPAEEYYEIVDSVKDSIDGIILSEFYFDKEGVMLNRMNIEIEEFRDGKLQYSPDGEWGIFYDKDKIGGIKRYAAELGIPSFSRSQDIPDYLRERNREHDAMRQIKGGDNNGQK